MSEIPFIDPRVKRMGTSDLRGLNADKLRQLSSAGELVVIHQKDHELAVVVPYEMYLEMSLSIRGFTRLTREAGYSGETNGNNAVSVIGSGTE